MCKLVINLFIIPARELITKLETYFIWKPARCNELQSLHLAKVGGIPEHVHEHELGDISDGVRE